MDKKLNVCLLNDSFPPTIDGVANTVFNYASVINDKFGDVVVATPKYPHVKDDYDFDVLRYASINTTGIIGYRAGYPFLPSLIGELESKNIDIIHTHCPAISSFLARALRERIDVPVVFTYHTKFDIDLKKALKSNMLQEASIKVIIDNIESCDEVWVVSEGAGENLRSLGYKGDYIVMENGVDFPQGKADDEEVEKINEIFGLRKDIPTFLFVGRLMWYKGLKITFDALKVLKNLNIDFQMLVVGNGEDAVDMKNYVSKIGIDENCVFAGAIQDREVLRACYTRADMFLFPSTYDTNGIVVREAAACGLGSVLIKGSCAAEGIVHERNGYLIDENAESMAEALKVLISNIEFAHEIGENAMNEIYISWEDSIKKAYDRYKIVIEKYNNDDYVKKTSFSDEAIGKIASVCESLNKAQKLRENITSGFISVPKNIIEKSRNSAPVLNYENHLKELKCGISEKKNNIKQEIKNKHFVLKEKQVEMKSGLLAKRMELKENLWHYVDRYL